MWKYCGFYMILRSIIVVSTIVNNRAHSFMIVGRFLLSEFHFQRPVFKLRRRQKNL